MGNFGSSEGKGQASHAFRILVDWYDWCGGMHKRQLGRIFWGLEAAEHRHQTTIQKSAFAVVEKEVDDVPLEELKPLDVERLDLAENLSRLADFICQIDCEFVPSESRARHSWNLKVQTDACFGR